MATKSTSSLEEFFGKLQAGDTKQLNLIVKADVQGSVGAVVTSVEKLSNEDVTVKVIHRGVGAVSESDLMLAETSGAIIIGFNVRPSQSVLKTADTQRHCCETNAVCESLRRDREGPAPVGT